jgi:hypothetical protein
LLAVNPVVTADVILAEIAVPKAYPFITLFALASS